MNKYLVLYRSSVTAAEQMAATTPEMAQAGMDLWMQWAGKAGEAILDLGSPLANAAQIGAGPAGGDHISGFSIMEAESADALVGLLDGHPHLQAPGASIEALEFLPVPGM